MAYAHTHVCLEKHYIKLCICWLKVTNLVIESISETEVWRDKERDMLSQTP